MDNMSPVHESLLKRLMFQIFMALNYIHVRGIVHRDIRAENFLFMREGSDHLKLIDFGSSKIIDDFD